jgi:2-polyprenyl-3-methyl-5-hydroxy-6-metoxy-1,4-benzoquinol methylase
VLQPLARIGANVTGIDASQNMIDVASSHAQQDPSVSNSITYICRTVEQHAKEHKDFYDAVVATEVLEHVNHKDLFLEACISTLKVTHYYISVLICVVCDSSMVSHLHSLNWGLLCPSTWLVTE